MAGPGAESKAGRMGKPDRIEEPNPPSSSRRREPSAKSTLGVSQPTRKRRKETQVEEQRQYVGIDLHRRRSVIVRMAADGSVLDTVRIENDPLDLAGELAKAGAAPEVAMEATLGWYWAANVIGDCGARLHLAHPLGIKAFAYQRVKKDESDARLLADLLRMGRLPEAWVAPPVAVGRKILTLVFYGLRDGEVRCLAEKAA